MGIEPVRDCCVVRENDMGGGMAWVADGRTKDNVALKVVHSLVFLVVGDVEHFKVSQTDTYSHMLSELKRSMFYFP